MLNSKALGELHRHFEGEIHLPEDFCDPLCRLASHNPTMQKRPAVIARCRHSGDIAVAIKTAREHGLDVAVRSGGHDVMGASMCDGGMLIDTALMKAIDIDAGSLRASVGAG